MPLTRARTSDVRYACTRPGNSMTFGTACVRTVTILTSGGGGAGGASDEQAASSKASAAPAAQLRGRTRLIRRSEEHTSELQSLMRISYAVFCLKKKNQPKTKTKRQGQQKHKKRNLRAESRHNIT